MKTKQGRFNYYEYKGDLGDPEAIGSLSNEQDFNYGTPNLTRHEVLQFVASNTAMKECVIIRIKWIPDETKKLVTVISRLRLILDDEVYNFEQVETYKPTESVLRPGRFTQYGSSSSKLKLFVIQPYHRSRVIFNGHMNRVGDNDTQLFVKLNCVINPLAQIYDFLEQYNEECLKQARDGKSSKLKFKELVSDLLLHDRHEQKVRLVGEYLIMDHSKGIKKQSTISIYGFYSRQFLDATSEHESKISTRRLYGYMNNGQAFQIGTRKLDGDEIDFGYTSFFIYPLTAAIDKPFKLDWQQLEEGKFELEISGQGSTFESRGKLKLDNWLEIEMNGRPGWAWLSLDDSMVVSDDEKEAIKRSCSERQQLIEAGKLFEPSEAANWIDQRPLVVSIQESSCTASQLVGSKASSLAQLEMLKSVGGQDSFEVPFAFVVTKFAHDLILFENQKLREQIDELRSTIAEGHLDNIEDKCKGLYNFIIKEVVLPDEIRQKLWTEMTNHYGGNDAINQDKELKFAVRSSSWGEDEEDMSAAGQLSTILKVKCELEELSRSIMLCFASKFNYENIEYKRQHGQPIDLPMAVIIQEMVACQKAGVMFTCDPTNGDESRIIITANYGLGESVVSAQADPDSIMVKTDNLGVIGVKSGREQRLDFNVEIMDIKIGQKNVIITDDGSSNQIKDEDKSKCCLNDEEILRLSRCGLHIRQYFNSQRRDIEWGYLNNQLYLFQSRPVTGLENYTDEELIHEADMPSQAELNYYTRANVGEVMPYPVKPLTMTQTVSIWCIVGARMYCKYNKDKIYVPQCPTEVFYQKYHAFFNLRCSSFLPLDDTSRSSLGRSMEIGFFGREMGHQPDIIEASKGFIRPPNPLSGTMFELKNLPLKLMPNHMIMREKVLLDKVRSNFRNLNSTKEYRENKMLAVYNQLRQMPRYLSNCWENHIFIILIGSTNNIVLSAFLSKYIKDPMQLSAATNKFLAISPDVVSAEIPARIRKMAKAVELLGEKAINGFVSMNSEEALAFIMADGDQNKQLREQYEEFVQRFGHRCYNEFELAELAWREKPESIAEMVQKNCKALIDLKAARSKQPDSTTVCDQNDGSDTRKPKSIDEVIESLNLNLSLMDRMMIKYILAPKCQQTLAMREKTKNVLVYYYDILREMSRSLAGELQRNLRIPDTDLFYYLMFDEVLPLIRNYEPSIVCQAVRRRQMFKRVFNQIWKFDEILSDIVPNHLKPSKELDAAIAQAPRLSGTPASSGKVRGKVCFVDSFKELNKVKPGCILLTHSTDIAFSPVFPLITGIITEVGGLISHGAVVAREYGLPSIIGIPDVTRILQDGEEIILDAENGEIIRLSQANGVE